MPIHFIINETKTYYTAKYLDKVKDEELIPAYRTFFEENEFCSGLPELVDTTRGNLSDLSIEGLRQLAYWGETLLKGKNAKLKRTAFLVSPFSINSPTGIIYGVMTIRSAEQLQIFENKSEAIQWLTEV